MGGEVVHAVKIREFGIVGCKLVNVRAKQCNGALVK
jgi:hypothetical protein